VWVFVLGEVDEGDYYECDDDWYELLELEWGV